MKQRIHRRSLLRLPLIGALLLVASMSTACHVGFGYYYPVYRPAGYVVVHHPVRHHWHPAPRVAHRR